MYFLIQGVRKNYAVVLHAISLKYFADLYHSNGSGCDISLHAKWVINDSYYLISWPSKYVFSNRKCKEKKMKFWPILYALAACHAYTNQWKKESSGGGGNLLFVLSVLYRYAYPFIIKEYKQMYNSFYYDNYNFRLK